MINIRLEIKAADGKVIGEVTISDDEGNIKITGEIQGIKYPNMVNDLQRIIEENYTGKKIKIQRYIDHRDLWKDQKPRQ